MEREELVRKVCQGREKREEGLKGKKGTRTS